MSFRSLVPILLLTILSVAAPATAGGLPQIEGGTHNGPRAYFEMCQREPALCDGDRAAGRVPGAGPVAVMSGRLWRQLLAVNARINARVRSAVDQALYGVSDYWTLARSAGDCEDFMIAKKQALIAAGWHADQLLYAVVEGTTTPYHAVLIARTDRGDLVLDNLSTRVVTWEESGYRFVIRQSAADPGQWVRVVNPAQVADSGASN